MCWMGLLILWDHALQCVRHCCTDIVNQRMHYRYFTEIEAKLLQSYFKNMFCKCSDVSNWNVSGLIRKFDIHGWCIYWATVERVHTVQLIVTKETTNPHHILKSDNLLLLYSKGIMIISSWISLQVWWTGPLSAHSHVCCCCCFFFFF